MRKIILSFLLAAGLTILPAAVIAHGQDDMTDQGDMHGWMHEHGMGMMGGGGGMGGCGDGASMMDGYNRGMMGLGPISMLDLTPDQRSKLNKIRYDLRKQHWAIMGKIIDEQAKLSDLYAADKPDPKKIGAVYGAIFDLRRQMIETQIDAMNRAKDILNKEQITKLKQLQQYRGMGTGGAMRHQMMRDMTSGGTGTR